ncbi:MAG TPA: hypothetical protein O0X42_00165 [Methanocorpusculum sp.]|nr:hypothetical protein [Methanocorpusculum sp.]
MSEACSVAWGCAVDIVNETKNLQDYLEDLQDELMPSDYDDIYHILVNLNFLYKYANDAMTRLESAIIYLDDTYKQNVI